jgi:CRISPR-associated endoribonuclease Cas6
MRFGVSFRNDQRELPGQYRRVFLSFLKHALETRGLLHLLARKHVRPYVFTVYLGKGMRMDRERRVFRTGSRITMRFSTGDTLLGAELLAALAELKGETYRYGDYNLTMEHVDVLRDLRVRGSRIRFKTLGIAVLTDPREDARDSRRWFVLPDDPRFPEVFALRARERFRLIQGWPYDGPLGVTVLRWKKDVAFHYEGVRGFRGILDVEADPVMLQFLYQYGIGVRTGQGFGFVDLAGGEA